MSDDYERRREERRENERRYRADVEYDVWRSGGNPDKVSYERVQQAFYDGVDKASAATRELRAQRPTPQEPEECEPEQEQTYPEEAHEQP